MPFTVPALRFPYEALEPHIDTETMKLHHDKHHAAYVSNLNKALEGGEFGTWSLEALVKDWAKLPDAIKATVRNNAGGHYNHSLLWDTVGPADGGKPEGRLAAAIEKDLGGFDAFKGALIKASLGRFGSGWGWLVLNPANKLEVVSTANQDSPLTDGSFPLLGIDVWEHAYYLKYQNRRQEYLEAFLNVVDWRAVGARFEKGA